MISKTTLKSNPERELPEAFKQFENNKIWLCSNSEGKPISPITGGSTEYNEPHRWGDFKTVREHLKDKSDHTPAIVIAPETGLVCIDLDDVINEKGELSPWAKETVERLDSYTEVSNSGKGLHIFAFGSKQGDRVKSTHKGKSVEIYSSSDSPKPIKLTGNIYQGRGEINTTQEAIDWFYGKYFPAKEEGGQSWQKSPAMKDDEIIEKLQKARNGDRFRKLFNEGDLTGNGGDASSADQALVNMIAFYTQDHGQIERICRRSELVRDKWDREDYLTRTINTALESLTNAYQGLHREKDSSPSLEFNEGLVLEEGFPIEVLPEILRNATIAVSRVSDSDGVIPATVAQALSAIAIRRTIKVIEKEEANLKHYLCFFHTIVGASAQSRKTANTKPFLSVFEEYHKEKQIKYKEEEKAYKNAQRIVAKQKEEIFKGDGGIREKATETAKLDLEVEKLKPNFYRLFATDVTGPAFVKRLGETDGCYSLFSTDAGDIIDFIIGNSQTGTNDMIFVKLITNDLIHVDRVGTDRKGVEIDIPEPCGNVFLMTQEERWARFNKHPRLLGSGLLGRNNPAVIPPRKEGYIENDGEISKTEKEIEAWGRMIRTLLNFGGDLELILSKETKLARKQLNNDWQSTVGVNQENYDVGDIIHRFVSECVKRAALFHVIDHWEHLSDIPKEIPLNTFTRAVAVQKYYLQQAINSRRGALSKIEAIEFKGYLEKWIEKAEKDKGTLGPLTIRNIQRMLRIYKGNRERFIEELEENSVIKACNPEGKAVKPRYILDIKRAKKFLKEG